MSRPRVRLVGSRTARSAFASINRQWFAALARREDLQLVDDDGDADVAIVHDFSTQFDAPPAEAARIVVAVRPWDFGPYPRRWVTTIEQHYEELWVHSRWTRDLAVDGGLDPSRVQIIPLGFDPAVMSPDGPRAALPAEDRFVFLFTGAAVHRKGVDLLLSAFRRAFSPGDHVALVVKDHTGDVFYRDQSYRGRILAAAASGEYAPIVYLDDYFPPGDLAALYRRADALVLPFRAEGFALPVLEAMACGTPTIVPAAGPCLDYCDDSTSLLIPTRVVSLPVRRTFTANTLGYEEFVEAVRFCETRVDRLAESLRHAVGMSAATASLGQAAAGRARAWTWDASAAAIAAHVHRLTASRPG